MKAASDELMRVANEVSQMAQAAQGQQGTAEAQESSSAMMTPSALITQIGLIPSNDVGAVLHC